MPNRIVCKPATFKVILLPVACGQQLLVCQKWSWSLSKKLA